MRLRAQDLNPETRRKLGIPLLSDDECKRHAYGVLGKIGRYSPEARWEILHRALQIDGGEPPPWRFWPWLWREMKKGWSLRWNYTTSK